MILTAIATLLLFFNPFFWVAIALFYKTKNQLLKSFYTMAGGLLVQLFSYPFLEIILETPKQPHLSLHQSLIGAAFAGILCSFIKPRQKKKTTSIFDYFVDI